MGGRGGRLWESDVPLRPAGHKEFSHVGSRETYTPGKGNSYCKDPQEKITGVLEEQEG